MQLKFHFFCWNSSFSHSYSRKRQKFFIRSSVQKCDMECFVKSCLETVEGERAVGVKFQSSRSRLKWFAIRECIFVGVFCWNIQNAIISVEKAGLWFMTIVSFWGGNCFGCTRILIISRCKQVVVNDNFKIFFHSVQIWNLWAAWELIKLQKLTAKSPAANKEATTFLAENYYDFCFNPCEKLVICSPECETFYKCYKYFMDFFLTKASSHIQLL